MNCHTKYILTFGLHIVYNQLVFVYHYLDKTVTNKLERKEMNTKKNKESDKEKLGRRKMKKYKNI